MGKNQKTVLKAFDYLHCDDFASYLSRMAGEGWHFKEWGAGLVFERGEPEQVTYAVEVFADGSEYDTRPEVNTREFAEYCEAAGWKLVDAKRKFCIFKRMQENAEEILTDEERLQNISREEQNAILQQLGMTVSFSILQLLQFSGSGFVNYIFSNAYLLIVLLWFALALGAAARAVAFWFWKRNAKKQIARDEKVYFGKTAGAVSFVLEKYSWPVFAIVGCNVVYSIASGQVQIIVYVAGALIPLILMAYLIARFRPDAVTNQIIQTVVPCVVMILFVSISLGIMFSDNGETVPLEEVPLLYEDIGGDAGELEEVTLDGSESIFGSGLRCWLYYEQEHIYYQVYRSDHPWVLDKIWNREMERKYNQLGTDVSELWNAEAAIRNVPGSYLVYYPDAILILNIAEDTVLSPEQVNTIRQTLLESR